MTGRILPFLERHGARVLVAAVVLLSVAGPLQGSGADAAATSCPAQKVGAPPAWFRHTGCQVPTAAPLSRTTLAEMDLFVRLNAERKARGLPALKADAGLSAAARTWSATMSASGFRHSDLTRLFGGKFNFVGENIAWARGSGATAGTIHRMWMYSSGHRENILGVAYDTVGIGVYCAPDGTMWATQNFARSASLGAAPALTVPPVQPVTRADTGLFSC